MECRTSTAVAEEIDTCNLGMQQYRKKLKEPDVSLKIKKARRAQAKDRWYARFCETCGEEFTDCGEQGFDPEGEDSDW